MYMAVLYGKYNVVAFHDNPRKAKLLAFREKIGCAKAKLMIGTGNNV